MAAFRGILQGNRGETSRLGSKSSGITSRLNSWKYEAVTHLRNGNYYNESGDASAEMLDVIIRTYHGERLLDFTVKLDKLISKDFADKSRRIQAILDE